MAQRILIVDDDKTQVLALASYLKAHGFNILSALDGAGALSTAVREKPDLVLLDLALPAGGGLGVLRRITELPALMGTPVIVVSSNKSPQIEQQILALGGRAFLPKPVDLNRLSAAVADVFSNSEVALS